MYVPMTRDDLDSSHSPVNGDIIPELADGDGTDAAAGAVGTHTHLDSVTSHRVNAPTLPADASAVHG